MKIVFSAIGHQVEGRIDEADEAPELRIAIVDGQFGNGRDRRH